jgi:hypothetical protein
MERPSLFRCLSLSGFSIATTVAVYVVFYFGVASGWWQPLSRPAGVTRHARFVFAGEGAAWFDCSVDAEKNVDLCKAWDPNGILRATGEFRLRGLGRAATASELRPTGLGGIEPDGRTRTIWLPGPHRETFGLALDQVN